MSSEHPKPGGRQDPPPVYGKNFRRAMMLKDAKAADIIKLTGMTSSTVGNWNKRGVSREHAREVAQFLGVRPERISHQYHVDMVTAAGQSTIDLAVPPVDAGDQLFPRREDLFPDRESTGPLPVDTRTNFAPPHEHPVTHRDPSIQARLDSLCKLMHRANLSHQAITAIELILRQLSDEQ